MSELKATPGPWFAQDDHPTHACYYIGPMGCSPLEVATVYSPGDEEADANAHLIAQSPAMYKSLASAPNPSKYAGTVGFETERFFADYQVWMDERRKVMATARGES